MSKISNQHIFDILPIVIQPDRKKRDIENEPHLYDSENNHHAIYKREVKPINSGHDIIDYVIPDGNTFKSLVSIILFRLFNF